jgi:UPF0755 protein
MITNLQKRPWAAAVSILALLFLIMAVRYAVFLNIAPGPGTNVQLFSVREGANLRQIARELEEKGLISSSRLFVMHVRMHGDAAQVKAGPYQFNAGMKPSEILKKMVDGDFYLQRFAVPEGYSIYQVAELLQQRKLFNREKFLAACSDRQLLKELGIPGRSVEGYLYPRTYDIMPGTTESGLIREMVGQFLKVYGERFICMAQNARLSRHEVVVLASMIEKEAVSPSEQPLIASVFHNRLKKGMRLQSDPTAVYGIRAFAGKVTKADIVRPTPYNTYLISGLPPGPIGNPGSGAIEAVLAPAKTDYLYFVARQDGSHQFSTTLDEHNRAVRQYLR